MNESYDNCDVRLAVDEQSGSRNNDFLTLLETTELFDDEFTAICHANKLYSYQKLAKYLVEKKDLELWDKALNNEWDEEDNEESHRQQLIDHIVDFALPDSTNADEVSCTVKAFIASNLPHVLIPFLERIILQESDFCTNKGLQNLLILTAIRSDASRVAGYIDQLDYFDAKYVALVCVSEEHMLYEESYKIYDKFSQPEFTQDKDEQVEMQVLALGVLLDFMKDLDRAKTYATQCDEILVWYKLAEALHLRLIMSETELKYSQRQVEDQRRRNESLMQRNEYLREALDNTSTTNVNLSAATLKAIQANQEANSITSRVVAVLASAGMSVGPQGDDQAPDEADPEQD